MFAIFELFFTLLRVLFYAIGYALLTLLAFRITLRWKENGWIKQLLRFRFLTFICFCAVYGITFLIYSFSYWKNTGFGDFARIPIGNGYSVSNIDAAFTYLEPERNNSGRQACLNKFIVSNGKLCSEFTGYNSAGCENCFIVFDIEGEKIYEFHSLNAYASFAQQNRLPESLNFKDFWENYNAYWSSKNKWYLP